MIPLKQRNPDPLNLTHRINKTKLLTINIFIKILTGEDMVHKGLKWIYKGGMGPFDTLSKIA